MVVVSSAVVATVGVEEAKEAIDGTLLVVVVGWFGYGEPPCPVSGSLQALYTRSVTGMIHFLIRPFCKQGVGLHWIEIINQRGK